MSTWLRNNQVPALAGLAGALVCSSIALIFFYAPEDADQGLSQKIFYFHVPIALTAYACFGWGAWKALLVLWKRKPGADLESYVAIHQGVIFGSLTLLTGSLWARISSSSWTTESGGSPPSFCDSDIDPRVGWNRTPTSSAAAPGRSSTPSSG